MDPVAYSKAVHAEEKVAALEGRVRQVQQAGTLRLSELEHRIIVLEKIIQSALPSDWMMHHLC